MFLFFRADKMPVRTEPTVGECYLPVACVWIIIVIAMGAQTERTATNRYSPLRQGFRAAGKETCE